MLKKTNVRTANTSNNAQKSSGDIRLFKVLDVRKDGVVVEFVDGKTSGKAFMEATPKFVELKNKSANFMAKSTGTAMHEKFYMALMRPTSNADHQYRKGQDILSAKVYPRNGTMTVNDEEIQKVSLAGGFTIFARADSQKQDPFDSSVSHLQPGDTWFQGLARIVHDPEAQNKVTGTNGSTWMEFVSEKGNPKDINSFIERVKEITSAKTGPSMFVRILNENGENDMHTSFYPNQKAEDVEGDLASIRELNSPMDRIVSWEIQPRVYLREEFIKSTGDSASKLERLRKDIAYTYSVDFAKTPIETEAVTRGERRVAGESFAVPMAVSLTMYKNDTTDGQWAAGSLRAVVPMGGDLVHSRQLFMTPEQRERALLAAPAQQAENQAHEQEAPQAAAPSTPAPAQDAASGMDLDFGS